jgi:hypothetical protein
MICYGSNGGHSTPLLFFVVVFVVVFIVVFVVVFVVVERLYGFVVTKFTFEINARRPYIVSCRLRLLTADGGLSTLSARAESLEGASKSLSLLLNRNNLSGTSGDLGAQHPWIFGGCDLVSKEGSTITTDI